MTRHVGWFGWVAVLALVGCSRVALAEEDPKNLYDVSFSATHNLKKGESGKFTVKIVAKNGGEIHKETPLSVAVHAPDAVAFSKAKYSWDDAQTAAGSTSVEAPFTAKASGAADINANLTFVICNPTNCFRQQVTGSAKVTVE